MGEVDGALPKLLGRLCSLIPAQQKCRAGSKQHMHVPPARTHMRRLTQLGSSVRLGANCTGVLLCLCTLLLVRQTYPARNGGRTCVLQFLHTSS